MTAQAAILWDMDGVLVDTVEAHYRSWLVVFEPYGISLDRERFAEVFGMNTTGALQALLGERATPELIADVSPRKEAIFREALAGNVRLLPGVRSWLDWFRERGIPQAIASSAPPANIDLILDELGIRSYFSAIVAGVDMPPKPAPDIFLAAARAISVPPRRCVVIEDAIKGVEGAVNAGMKCIAVTTTNPAPALAHADLIVDSLADIPPAIVLELLESR